MKRLVIVRHAKTESGGYDHDFERALTIRGRNDAMTIATDLVRRNIIPGLIISSPAKRAITTARIFADIMKCPASQIIEEKRLYFDYTTTDFLEMIHEAADDQNTVMVIGHNPFIYFVAEKLSRNFEGDMPTCSAVVLEFEAHHWSQIEARKGKAVLHLVPSMFE